MCIENTPIYLVRKYTAADFSFSHKFLVSCLPSSIVCAAVILDRAGMSAHNHSKGPFTNSIEPRIHSQKLNSESHVAACCFLSRELLRVLTHTHRHTNTLSRELLCVTFCAFCN